MDAWNDCMSDYCYSDGIISLQIDNVADLKAKNLTAFHELIDCCAFINWRETEKGNDPLIVLSFA